MKIEHGKTEKKNSLKVDGRRHLLHFLELFRGAGKLQLTECRVRSRDEDAHSSSL